MTNVYEKRYQIQRVAKSLDYHIEALRLIPEYDDNQSVRAVHEKHLNESINELRGLLK